MIKHIFKVAFAVILILSSCNHENLEIGRHLVNSHVTFGKIDTITVRVSNIVAVDSVVTSGRGVGYWGSYTDPHIGTVLAKTFIEFNRTLQGENDRGAVFDSVTLVLRSNGNYYGDTIKHAAVKVFRLEKQIERGIDGNLYSSSETPVIEDFILADATFKFGVKDLANNEVEIKLPDSFGERLFQGIVRDEDDYKTADFKKTFSGLAVYAGDASDCVYGVLLNDTACMVRIYYHINTTSREDKTMTFAANQFESFYHMTNDNSRLLPPYTQAPTTFDSKTDPVLSSLMGNVGVITSGSTPVFARLEFPHLNNLFWLGQIVKIKQAILYVRPVQESFDIVPLPTRLNLFEFESTSSTMIGSALSLGPNMGPQNGNLPENYRYIQRPDFPQYTFDITNFISNELGKSGHEKRALSLLISNDTRERENTIQRLVFGNQNFWLNNENQSRENRIQLEITYAVYND